VKTALPHPDRRTITISTATPSRYFAAQQTALGQPVAKPERGPYNGGTSRGDLVIRPPRDYEDIALQVTDGRSAVYAPPIPPSRPRLRSVASPANGVPTYPAALTTSVGSVRFVRKTGSHTCPIEAACIGSAAAPLGRSTVLPLLKAGDLPVLRQ
jgi:hypothetical protein